MRLTLVKKQSETHDVESFYWSSDTPVEYKPGQYLKWTLDDDEPDDRGNTRFFSISSSPTEELIMNTTKFNAERSSSFKSRLKEFSPGDTINAVGPMGNFVLPDDSRQPLVLLAGGIGITPFRSMIRYLADSALEQPVHLLYSCRTSADIAFQELFEALEANCKWLKVTYVIETPDDGWTGEVGRLDAERIQRLAGGLDGKKTYLSGPEPMVKTFYDGLVDGGVWEDSLKTDYFPGYS